MIEIICTPNSFRNYLEYSFSSAEYFLKNCVSFLSKRSKTTRFVYENNDLNSFCFSKKKEKKKRLNQYKKRNRERNIKSQTLFQKWR